MENEKRLREIEAVLTKYYDICVINAKSEWNGLGKNSPPLESINPSSNGYKGIWPDDFEFIMLAGEPLSVESCQKIAQFCTHSVIGLTRFPDSLNEDGMPLMGFCEKSGARMSASLPGAWIRMLNLFEERGVTIPKKNKWADLFIRAISDTEFSCGLAYVSPFQPHITFPFHDIAAITGFDLMSSVAAHRSFITACKFFADVVPDEILDDWRECAQNIQNNLYRLFDEEKGIFLAGSYDNRQPDIWGSGLAYALADENQKRAIGNYFEANKKQIFREGLTCPTETADGWSRFIVPHEPGNYMNGGYWSLGTAFVLTALYDQKPERAMEVLEDLVVSMPKYDFAESVNMIKGTKTNPGFMAGVAMPLVAVRAILDGKQLLDVI